MDDTKQPLGVATMVHGDYFFLERWYRYYKSQVGAQSLYIFSHGGDPEHRRIAPDANVINIPRDETMHRFDRRRWRMLSNFTSGMLQFYHWMILADVDELVVVDPDVSAGLVDHLQARYWDPETAPINIAPMCLDLVHYPEDEHLPITAEASILSRRRTFRPNRNYSKPCLVRAPVVYRAGGHFNNLKERHLPDDLYTIHLKFFDSATIEERTNDRVETVLGSGKVTNGYGDAGRGFYAADKNHGKILERLTFAGEGLALPEIRAQMLKQVEKKPNCFIYGNIDDDKLYRLPERFAHVL